MTSVFDLPVLNESESLGSILTTARLQQSAEGIIDHVRVRFGGFTLMPITLRQALVANTRLELSMEQDSLPEILSGLMEVCFRLGIEFGAPSTRKER